MNLDKNERPVQAFPITAGTWQGTPTNQFCRFKIVHVADGGDVTFHYSSGDVTVTASIGQDFAISGDCTGLTSAATVIIG